MSFVFFKVSLVCVVIVLCFGCDSPTEPIHNPELRTITTYQGAWSGTTNEGFSVSFTVVGNTITSFVIEMLFSLPNKAAERMTYFSASNEIISGSDFSIPVYLNPSTDQSISRGTPISGHFTSTTAAEGISIPETGSGVTWKAEKN
jgi:hypothetical protein